MTKVGVFVDQEKHLPGLASAAGRLSADISYFKISPDRIDSTAAALVPVVHGYDYLLFPSTVFYRGAVPALACRLNVSSLTDVVQIEDGPVFLRYLAAGQALVRVRSTDRPLPMTVMTHAFPEVPKPSFQELSLDFPHSLVTRLSVQGETTGRPDLDQAKIVIGVGMGLADPKNDLPLIFDLADRLKAAVCATRPLIDAGFFPHSAQVGQTGRSVAPDVYLALGISGAMQHLAGLKNARKVIAVNTDPSAPIFKFAHAGLVSDLKDVAHFLLKR